MCKKLGTIEFLYKNTKLIFLNLSKVKKSTDKLNEIKIIKIL